MLVRAFVEGELGHFLNAQAKAVDVGGRKAMRLTAGAIRKKIAGNVRRAFPGGGGTTLAKLVRSRISGKGADIEGTVFSRAAYGRSSLRPGGPIDLVQLYAQGATIKSARGGYLAIPTENAPLKSARGPRGHSPDLAATLWPNTTSLAQAVIGEQTHVYMPLKPGTYFARTYDADGRASTNFSSISTTQASLLTFSPVGSIIEDPLFTGGKANCTVTSGQLTLTPDTLDQYLDVTVLSWWGITGGSAEAGQYNFAVGMDLGSVKRCRITSHVKVEAINESDYWDSKIGPIDTWPDIDGTIGAVVDAQCWGKHDTVAYGTYANWFEAPPPLKRIDAVEAEVRSIGALQLRLTCEDPGFNLRVLECRLTADEVV